MTKEELDALVERIRTELFGNLVHYRQRCAHETDDALKVAGFIEREPPALERVLEWVRSGRTLDELRQVGEAVRDAVRGIADEVDGRTVQ